MSIFTKDDYFSAAFERVNDSKKLFENPQNVIGAIYFAGVAIESMFRAYICRYTNEFYEKHNLESLYIKSLMHQYLNDSEKEKMSVTIKKAAKLWDNTYRYCSAKRLKRMLGHEFAKQKNKPKDMYKYLQSRSGELTTISEEIVRIGGEKWT